MCQELQPDGAGRERRPSHVDTNPPPQSDILVECPICGRKFAKDRIQRHMEVQENLAIRACRNYDDALDCCEESSSNLKKFINLLKFFQVCKAAQDKKPRDVFDVQGQRLQGTEAEGNLNSLRRENSSDLGMTMTNWKSQHDQVSDQSCLGSGWILLDFQIFL